MGGSTVNWKPGGGEVALVGCFQVVPEASGVDDAADGVVREVAEAQGDTSEVLHASAWGLGEAVGGTGAVDSGPGCRHSVRSGFSPVP